MKCYKGTILSVDPNDGEYRYLVEDDGVIVHIGNASLSTFKVEQLILSGKPYESAVTPLVKCIRNGLFSKNKY